MLLKIDQGLKCFVVPENVFGVPEFPNADGHIIVPREDFDIGGQEATYKDAVELLPGTLSIINTMREMRGPGSAKLPVFLRPDGTTPGSPRCTEYWLLRQLLGTATGSFITNPQTVGSAIIFSPRPTKTSATAFFFIGDVCIFLTGLVFTDGEFAQEGKGGHPTADFSGSYARLGWTGVTTLTEEAAGGQNKIIVADASLFSVGSWLRVGTVEPTATKYRVTAIDLATNELTLLTNLGATIPDNSAVIPATYLLGASIKGAPIPYRPEISIDSIPISYKGWKFKISAPVDFIADEVPADPTEAEFPTDFIVKPARTVEGEITGYMRSEDLSRLNASDTKVPVTIDFSGEAAEGTKLQINFPYSLIKPVQPAKGSGAVERTIAFRAYASAATSGEDEVNFKYF